MSSKKSESKNNFKTKRNIDLKYSPIHPKGIHFNIKLNTEEYGIAQTVHRIKGSLISEVQPLKNFKMKEGKPLFKNPHPDIWFVETAGHGYFVFHKKVKSGYRNTIIGNEDDGIDPEFQKQFNVDRWGSMIIEEEFKVKALINAFKDLQYNLEKFGWQDDIYVLREIIEDEFLDILLEDTYFRKKITKKLSK